MTTRKLHSAPRAMVLLLTLGLATSAGCDQKTENAGSDTKSSSEAKGASSSAGTNKDAPSAAKKEEKPSAGSAMSPPATASAASSSATPAPAPTAPAASAPSGATGVAAWSHLPQNCDIAATMDLGKTLASPTFSKDVTPKIDDILGMPSSKDKSFDHFLAFMRDASLTRQSFSTLAACLRETGKKDPSYLLVVGGDLKPGTLIPALEKAASAKAKDDLEISEVNGIKIGTIKSKNVTIGQFADGSIALSDDVEFLKAGMATGNNAATLGLDTSKEISLVVGQKMIQSKIATGKAKDVLAAMTSIAAEVDLGSKRAQARAKTKSPEDAKKLDSLITLGKDEVIKKEKNPALVDLLKAVQSRVDGNDVVIELPIPDKSLEMAAQTLTGLLAQAKTKL
ncbi:MAG: hypothetical protein U0271_30490 [Polyangiaceae bacterium]